MTAPKRLLQAIPHLPGRRLRRGRRDLLAASLAALASLLVLACAPPLLGPGGTIAEEPKSLPAADLRGASLPASPTPVPPTATPPPLPTVTPEPPPRRVTLDEFWVRMQELAGARVFDYLSLLPPQYRDDPLFGINNALAAEDAAAPLFRGIGATIDRVEVRWDDVEPAPGVYDFERLDRLVAAAERWDLSVLAVVDGAPAWAVDRPDRVGTGPPKGLDAPALLPGGGPNPENPWARFVYTLARRYGRRIAAWEVWNEPNIRQFWRGSPADYGRLLRVAATVLRSEAPGSPVLTAGMVQDDGAFLREVVASVCPERPCASPPFDAVAWHVYNNPRDVLRVAGQTRAALEPSGLRPAIWITEANVPIDDPLAPLYPGPGPGDVSLSEQAAFVVQAYALARAADVRVLAVYRAADVDEGRRWGLLRQNWSGRPAVFAYRTAAQWLSHTRFVRLDRPAPDVTLVQLRRQGETVYVLWTDSPRPMAVRVESGAACGLLVGLGGLPVQVHPREGAFRVTLPAAPPPRAAMVALGEPRLLVVPDDGGACGPPRSAGLSGSAE